MSCSSVLAVSSDGREEEHSVVTVVVTQTDWERTWQVYVVPWHAVRVKKVDAVDSSATTSSRRGKKEGRKEQANGLEEEAEEEAREEKEEEKGRAGKGLEEIERPAKIKMRLKSTSP